MKADNNDELCSSAFSMGPTAYYFFPFTAIVMHETEFFFVSENEKELENKYNGGKH